MNKVARLSRLRAVLLVAVSVAAIGGLIQFLPGDWSLTTQNKQAMIPAAVPQQPSQAIDFNRQGWALPALNRTQPMGESRRAAEVRVLFEHALSLMQEGRYPQAINALEMVITLAPQMPEAFVNLGFVLYDVSEFDAARGAFQRAIELNAGQGNAYYGLAITYEQQGDLEMALGAMRSFLHVTEGSEPFKAKARAAIWEWENALGRYAESSAASSAAASSAVPSTNPS